MDHPFDVETSFTEDTLLEVCEPVLQIEIVDGGVGHYEYGGMSGYDSFPVLELESQFVVIKAILSEMESIPVKQKCTLHRSDLELDIEFELDGVVSSSKYIYCRYYVMQC